jgi:hypothetical protein
MIVAFCAFAFSTLEAPCVCALADNATDPRTNAAAANVIANLPIRASICGEENVNDERDRTATLPTNGSMTTIGFVTTIGSMSSR